VFIDASWPKPAEMRAENSVRPHHNADPYRHDAGIWLNEVEQKAPRRKEAVGNGG
jgi:hypothetical protein